MPHRRGGENDSGIVLNGLVKLCEADGVDPAIVHGMLGRRQVHEARSEITAAGKGHIATRVIVSGWSARLREAADGRRQIISFRIPGDTVSLRRVNDWSSSGVVALTRLETVDVSDLCDHLDARLGRRSAISQACMASAGNEESHILDHVIRLGQQEAVERMAHLFVELSARLRTVGLNDGDEFDFPVKQEHLGEALGMTLVHVNRTLQRLRANGLVQLRGGRLRLLQPGRLARIAGTT